MNFAKTFISMSLCMVMWVDMGLVMAQENSQFKLLDGSTLSPISGATFQYGSQSGVSTGEGDLFFTYTVGLTMQLSHINYGKWQLADNQIKTVMKSGVSYRESITINLYPVTVIAVKPKNGAAEKMDLDYQDQLSHDGGAILNQTPAMNSIRKSGNYGFDPVFRGFKYDQLNVVFNGAQSATAACPNRMDPPTSQMAPNMINRIEILKGPHGLRYGTGFGATINFVPEKLRFTDGPGTYGRVSGGYDTNGDIWRTEGLIGFNGQKYDLSVFAAWSQGNDYKAGNGNEVQSDFLRGSFGANLGLKLTNNQELRISATRNLARDVDFPALPMDLRTDDTWMINARHDIIIDKGNLKSWNTTAFASFVDHLMDNLLKPLDPRMLNAETPATTYNYGGRTEGIWNFQNGTLYAGMDLRVESAEGTRSREFLMGPNAGNILRDNAWQNGKISKTGLFAEYHLIDNQYHFVFSGRVELNSSDIADPSEEFTQVHGDTEEVQINPNASIGAIRDFENGISLGLWLGRAQRSGSLTERFINYFPVGQDPFEMLGNPQLKPEVNNQADLTVEWKKGGTGVNLDIFASYMQDFILSEIDPDLSPRLPNSPGVRRFINIDNAFKTGFELSWAQELFAGLQHQVALAYTYAEDLEQDAPLPEIAPLDMRYTLRGNYLDDKLRPEVTFRHVSRQSRISTEFGETVTPSFSLLDLKIGYQLNALFNFSAGVNNLLDENYYEHLNRSVRGNMPIPIFAPGRNVFASFNVTF